MSKKNHFWRFVWLAVFAILIFSLGRSLWLTRLAKLEIVEQQEMVNQLEKQVSDLESEVKTATSSYELERRVREELHRQRPEEVIIRLPESL
jgi:cell division protein FtsB